MVFMMVLFVPAPGEDLDYFEMVAQFPPVEIVSLFPDLMSWLY